MWLAGWLEWLRSRPREKTNRRGVTVVEGDWLFGMAGGTVMCRNELREAPTPQCVIY